LDHDVSIVMSTPGVDGLDEAVRALREWQCDGAPVQLHPGDLGWYRRFGAEATARAVRTWRRDGEILAVGLLDGPGLVRLGIAPAMRDDEDLAHQMAADVSRPDRGVLPSGSVTVEARGHGVFRELLLDGGWDLDESWTPLRRDLAEPVADGGLRIEAVGPARVGARVAVQRAAFDRSTFTEEGWHAMAAASSYADGRCLVGYDDHGSAVAVATVWSAGPGRPGLLEPVGVHRDHRGHGYGTAISVAAAAALREMGSSSAIVCTRSANVRAVATYRSAGFQQLPDVPDLHRGVEGMFPAPAVTGVAQRLVVQRAVS
jgi:ribosomal protein S18 acetylase RimI-like enzyme